MSEVDQRYAVINLFFFQEEVRFRPPPLKARLARKTHPYRYNYNMLAKAERVPQPILSRALLLPLLASIVVFSLFRHGPSCGHDFGFHMQSWMDAAEQMRHGPLLPRWAFSPAFNAGEPRFVFYPPLSWLWGAFLLLLLPPALVPAVYTWCALSAAAFAMYTLASAYTTRRNALLAAAVYLANPYLLFTAFERTAYAELLAAAWLPLLFRAALAPKLAPLPIAIPLALLWLTNAPAAVMGTYTFALIAIARAAQRWYGLGSATPARKAQALWQLLRPALGGLLLGLTLPGFYLVPAAFERRYVQIAMAVIPNMRVEDNFLFGHTGYGPHDAVLHTASLVALATVGLTALALTLAFGQGRQTCKSSPGTTDAHLFRVISTEGAAEVERPAVPGPETQPVLQAHRASALAEERGDILSILILVAAIATLLLWQPTLPIWHLLPELTFLQFPWRLLAILGGILGLATALALGRVRLSATVTLCSALAVVAAGTALAIRPFRQGCEAFELPAARVALFQAHHGGGPTDEYTPVAADNDQLRWDDPAWWLAADPNAPGPRTVPNPASTIVDYDQPPPLDQTVSGRAPHHLQFHLAQPATLVLNLRDYPAWQVTVNGNPHPARLERDDGLLALALPAGEDTVDLHWRTLPDVYLGDALSLCALVISATLLSRRFRSRRIDT